jgi:hypothetical protein
MEMTRTNNRKIGVGRLVLALGVVLGFAVAGGTLGCDDYGYDRFYPDFDTVQSVLDYRTDVYDAANDAWDEYIRM